MVSELTKESLRLDLAVAKAEIVKFIRTTLKKAGKVGVVLGLSGGVDSSTVAALCVSALEAKNVMGLIMPSSITRSEDVEDAKFIAKMLGIEHEIIKITPLEEAFSNLCHHYGQTDRIATGNVTPRVRMTILYYHANSLNRLVVGTGNKSELVIGYYTKYGDGGVDILPIGDLYKTQVRKLAEYLGIPKSIIHKVPTAGLWAGQTDEDEIGVKYDVLDLILHGLMELRMKPMEIARQLEIPVDTVNRVLAMMQRSEHKRQPPPIAKISWKKVGR